MMMDKKARLTLKTFFVLGLLAIIFYVSSGFAAHVVTVDGYNTSLYGQVLEDIGYMYNITINNSDNTFDSNITKVNITLPTGFVFRPGPLSHNGTSLGVGNYSFESFGNTSLVWENASSMLFNGSVTGMLKNFWFNATVDAPGWYNITVETTNVTGTYWSNVSLVVNDTTPPNTTTINSPASSWMNVSGVITLNATIIENGVMSAVHFNITNATGGGSEGVYQNLTTAATNTVGNVWVVTFDTGGLTNGFHNITVWANDTYNNVNNTAIVTVNVNNTLPEPSYGVLTENDGTNFSRSWIYVNVSFTQNSSAENITFTLHNQTAQVNQTIFNMTYTYVHFINWTGLTESNYTYNVTVTDRDTNNRNTTITRGLVLDTTAPSVTAARSSSSTDTQIVVDVTLSDPGSRINGECGVDGYGAESVTVSGASSNSVSQTLTVIGFSCGQSASIAVSCSDYASNVGSSTSASMSTNACSSGGSGGGGGGGSSTSLSPYSWGTTFDEANVEFSSVSGGVTKTLGNKQRVKLKISKETHYVGVVSVSSTSAIIEISSAPQETTFNVGETKKFDITDDGFYDLKVTLNSISSSKADITIESIYEQVIVPTPPEEPAGEVEEDGTDVGEIGSAERESTGASRTVWIVVVLLIVIAVVVWFVLKGNPLKKK